MRLVTVSQLNNRPYIAAVFYDRFVTQLTGALGDEIYLRTMVDFIRAGSTTWNESYARAKIPTDTAVMLKKCKLHAPIIPRSLRDFYAFEEHVKTANANRGREVPTEWYEVPVFYYGNTSTIYGTEEIIPYPSKSTALDYELEIACVIGKEGRDIPADKAEEYIFGYMIFNDWSARDLQKQEMAVGLGPAKGKDFASSFGPYLVTSDELVEYHTGRPGVYDLKMIARVNDKEYSRGNMKDMHWSFGELIARASQDVTLYPGDVIASGTVGTGCLLELTKGEGPWLQPGDVVELEIEHLGILRNIVGDRPGASVVPRQTAEQVGVLLVTPVTDVPEAVFQSTFETMTPATPTTPAEAPARASTPAGTPSASTDGAPASTTPPVTPTTPSTQQLSQAVTPSDAPASPSTQAVRAASPVPAAEDVSPEGLTVIGGATPPTSTSPSVKTVDAVNVSDTKPVDKSLVQSAQDRAASENAESRTAPASQPQPEVENNAAVSPPVTEPTASTSDGAGVSTNAVPTDDAPVAGESAPSAEAQAADAATPPPASNPAEPAPSETSTHLSASDSGVQDGRAVGTPAQPVEVEDKTPTPLPTSNTNTGDDPKGSSHG
jgi:fumarylacetoacetate (FAA) hydrolase